MQQVPAPSSNPAPLSVTIIALNEEANIARALRSVEWAAERVVVDSGSTDRTVEIARSLGAKVVFKEWLGFGAQKNFAHSLATQDWVLNIDADEWVTPESAEEIKQLLNNPNSNCFEIPRKTYYLGKWIKHGGWYPNYVTRLGKKSETQWSQPHVHEKLEPKNGPILRLKFPLEHNAFPTITDQINTNLKYAMYGARDLIHRGRRPSLLKLVFKPIGKFLETFVWKQGFRDGLRGFIISVNAAHSMFLKFAFLYEDKVLKHEDSDRRQ